MGGYAFEEAECVGSESDVIFVVAFSDLKIVGVGFLFVPEEKCVFQLQEYGFASMVGWLSFDVDFPVF